jgi:hypothetical protein
MLMQARAEQFYLGFVTSSDPAREQMREVFAETDTRLPPVERARLGARHFYASALIHANLNPKVIQSRLGHATIAETMDTYGHLFPDSEDLGRGAVEGALAAAQAEQERNSSAW